MEGHALCAMRWRDEASPNSPAAHAFYTFIPSLLPSLPTPHPVLPAGTPVSIVLPALPGFSVRPGTETQAGLGYKCEGSLLLHSCMLQAPVQVRGRGRAAEGWPHSPATDCPATDCNVRLARQLRVCCRLSTGSQSLPCAPHPCRTWQPCAMQTPCARPLCTCPTGWTRCQRWVGRGVLARRAQPAAAVRALPAFCRGFLYRCLSTTSVQQCLARCSASGRQHPRAAAASNHRLPHTNQCPIPLPSLSPPLCCSPLASSREAPTFAPCRSQRCSTTHPQPCTSRMASKLLRAGQTCCRQRRTAAAAAAAATMMCCGLCCPLCWQPRCSC